MEQWPEQSNLLTAEQCHAVINSDHVTRLILLQQLHRLGLVDYSPLDDPEFVAAVQTEGGEGVECRPPTHPATGQHHEKNFYLYPGGYPVKERFNNMLLDRLIGLEIYKIELRMLDRFERGVLSRVAQVMEADQRARKRFKARWMARVRGKERRRRQRKKRKEEKIMAKQEDKAGGDEKETSRDLGDEKEAFRDQGEDILGEMLEGKMPVPDEPMGSVEERREELREQGQLTEEIKVPRSIEPNRPEVELEVLRIPPNPRCVICRYRLLADEIRINLWVKTNKNFKRGMKLKMHEQAGEDWQFAGVLPRHAGRW